MINCELASRGVADVGEAGRIANCELNGDSNGPSETAQIMLCSACEHWDNCTLSIRGDSGPDCCSFAPVTSGGGDVDRETGDLLFESFNPQFAIRNSQSLLTDPESPPSGSCDRPSRDAASPVRVAEAGPSSPSVEGEDVTSLFQLREQTRPIRRGYSAAEQVLAMSVQLFRNIETLQKQQR